MTDEPNAVAFANFLRAKGVLREGPDGKDITPEGRAWLRSIGISIPDDKSLLQLGFEALVDEVVTEEMERQAGRKTSGGRN